MSVMTAGTFRPLSYLSSHVLPIQSSCERNALRRLAHIITRMFASVHQLTHDAERVMDVKRPRVSITRPDGLLHHHCARAWPNRVWKLRGLHRSYRNDVAICFMRHRTRDDQVRSSRSERAGS